MYANLFQTSFLVIISILLHHLPTSSCNDDVKYVACAGRFHCANIPSLGYPFWRDGRPEHCGHPGFRLNCENDVPILSIQSTPYRVLGIDTRALLLTVARQDIWNNTCPQFLYNTSLDYKLFSHPSGDQNLTLYYGCTTLPIQGLHLPNEFNCTVNETTSDSYFVTTEASIVPNPNLVNCSQSLTVPVNKTAALALTPPTSVGVLRETLASGFGLLWEANDTYCNECSRSSGRCGYNSSSGSFACYCVDGPYPFVCNETDGNSSSNPKILHIVFPVIGAIFAGIGIGWLIFFCRQRRKRRLAAQNESKDVLTDSTKGLFTTPSTNFTQSIPSYPSLKSMVGKGSTYFGAQVFSYTELEQATDNFSPSKELGEGGFGTVYYGTLHDGRVVAVKRLYENNFKRLEQFMNEVKILTQLQHENLVKLYGCTSKRSRELLLVYEYIPNGTVADHLHGKQASSGFLSWPVRMNIAIETAEALAYLHASDIIHRDVKTNNILLDKNFCVKVADFGLSRLFPNDATHVSTAPQGTPGYVDPEYYRMYKLTDKSDVYSFGVVLIELISSLQAVDTNRHTHDINLANMAINKIQNQSIGELVDQNLGYEADAWVRKMTIMVAELAFRCLQEDNDMRPSMKEVVDTLRSIQNEKEFDARKVEALEILVDDSAPLKGKDCPISPDSVADKWISSNSTSISSG